MRFGQIKFLHDEVGVPLICLDFPSLRGASEDAIEKSAFRTFLDGFALGGRSSRPGSGARYFLPPTVDGPWTHTLGLDLESVLESRFEPSDSVSGSDGGEIIPVKECSEVSLPVVVQAGVVLTTLET